MRRIVVFGATSAIAAPVITRWAARGDRLHLIARDPARLAAVAAACSGHVSTQVADFTDTDRAPALVDAARTALGGGIDLALIAHGDLGDQQRSEHDYAEAARLLAVNLLSVVALLIPLADQLERQGAGHIAVMGSVAGDRGRPRNYTYGAAKGALTLYLQGLRSRLYPVGVAVTTLKLGPVDTPMTVDHAKNPLFTTPERLAPAIVRAIDRRAGEVYLPWYWRPILAVVRNTPEPLFQRLRFLSGR